MNYSNELFLNDERQLDVCGMLGLIAIVDKFILINYNIEVSFGVFIFTFYMYQISLNGLNPCFSGV